MKRQFFRENTNSLIYNIYLVSLAQMSCTTHTLYNMLLRCIFSSFPTEIAHSFGKHICKMILPLLEQRQYNIDEQRQYHGLFRWSDLVFFSVGFAGVLSA